MGNCFHVKRARIIRLGVAVILTLGVRMAMFAQTPPGLELSYHLRLARPTTHLVEVEISAAKVSEAALDFVLPAWAPGRYAIYDFAKNVQEFSARDGQGHVLPWAKLDKLTWHVDASRAGGVTLVRYLVYANDLTGSFSQFDSTHASITGASVFMYVAGHKEDPVSLTVEAPAEWKVVSGFSDSLEQRVFQVPNYDVLIDTPLEVSPEVKVEQFVEGGKTFHVAFHSYSEEDTDFTKLSAGVRKIVQSEMSMMPKPDFSRYVFIFHFAPDVSLGDGMEHLNSTHIVVKGSLSGGALDEALVIAAHEFFHAWNVKRLRPQALGPFDYTRENYTPSLWFAEGVTQYYSYVHMLRCGLWRSGDFLQHLADEIRSLEFSPGRKLMSAESSSFNAWFYDRSPQMQETNFANATVSYYNKGALLGLLLDLEIRSRTQGRKSLDDVLRLMYQKFYETTPSSYYGSGRGYEEKDILEALNAVSGSDFTSFFDRYVRGTEELPYAAELGSVGLQLQADVAPGAGPSLGVTVEKDERGEKITSVRPGSAADLGGMSRDDLLLAVDEQPLTDMTLRERLRAYPAGAEVPFTLERHGRELRITIKLDPPIPTVYTVGETASPTPEQTKLREGWLDVK